MRFENPHSHHIYILLNPLNYYVPRVRTKRGQHAFSYAGPVVWNNLPLNIHAESEIACFKKNLKTSKKVRQ